MTSPNGHKKSFTANDFLTCPACYSHRTSWSGRWRCCQVCGCSWRYRRDLERALLEVAA